jgi:hypothetical protein
MEEDINGALKGWWRIIMMGLLGTESNSHLAFSIL